MDSQQIGHFEVLDQLGEGTVGQVFRARNVETGEVVALKLLRGNVAHESDRPNLTQRLKSTRHSAGDQVSWIGLAAIGLVIVVGLVVYLVVANQ